MKSSLIIFGVIFLVIGGLLYVMPKQELRADTTTSGNGAVDSRTSSARITVPVEWAYGSLVIGLVLLLFGVAIQSTIIRSGSKDHTYEKTVESKFGFDADNRNKHTTVRERTETH